MHHAESDEIRGLFAGIWNIGIYYTIEEKLYERRLSSGKLRLAWIKARAVICVYI